MVAVVAYGADGAYGANGAYGAYGAYGTDCVGGGTTADEDGILPGVLRFGRNPNLVPTSTCTAVNSVLFKSHNFV